VGQGICLCISCLDRAHGDIAHHRKWFWGTLIVFTLTPILRKLTLTAHVTLAVGWLGAVAAFLALAIIGVTSQDILMVRSVYVAMDLIARNVVVPLSFAPLITGPILSFGTPWGLLRHYWILAKLIITILCTIIMQLHMNPIAHLAGMVAKDTLLNSGMRDMQIQMVVASAAALVALVASTALGVYKPQGMTQYGWRKYEERMKLSDK
jgi:hypothetical protein